VYELHLRGFKAGHAPQKDWQCPFKILYKLFFRIVSSLTALTYRFLECNMLLVVLGIEVRIARLYWPSSSDLVSDMSLHQCGSRASNVLHSVSGTLNVTLTRCYAEGLPLSSELCLLGITSTS
jgi:hypothetical protein